MTATYASAKLRELLAGMPRGTRAELGRQLGERYGSADGRQLILKWQSGKGFNRPQQLRICEMLGLERDYFEAPHGGDTVAAAVDDTAYRSLRDFLAEAVDEDITTDERHWLTSQRFSADTGDIGSYDWWFSELLNYRAHRRLARSRGRPQPPPNRTRAHSARRS